MGISFKSERLCEELRNRANAAAGRKAIRVGVTKEDVVDYARYVEFGWVQRVTAKQSLFLSAAIGRPVPNRADGRPAFSAAAVKVGTSLVNPPRPFLRGTLSAEGKKWAAILKNKLAQTGDPDQALDAVGAVAVGDIMNTIASGGTSKEKFEKRSPLTMALLKASAEGHDARGRNAAGKSNSTTDQPLVLNGNLLNSIGYKHV